MVKGLARQRAVYAMTLRVKYVDVNLFENEERLLPSDGRILADGHLSCRSLPGGERDDLHQPPL